MVPETDNTLIQACSDWAVETNEMLYKLIKDLHILEDEEVDAAIIETRELMVKINNLYSDARQGIYMKQHYGVIDTIAQTRGMEDKIDEIYVEQEEHDKYVFDSYAQLKEEYRKLYEKNLRIYQKQQ